MLGISENYLTRPKPDAVATHRVRPDFVQLCALLGRIRENFGRIYPARTICSAESNAFIDPERNPSRSRVTNLNPSGLKILVNAAAMSGVKARGISSRAISIRAISP